jgi:hypothetical protein
MRAFRWLAPVFILLILLGILVPISPVFRPVPSDDPSVFLYIGQRILEGSVPYRDAWDHKQPLTFLLFALGQFFTPHSLWGMWYIDLALLGAAALLALRLMYQLVSRWIAFLAVAAGFFTLAITIWGYSLEELSLPLQFLCLVAMVRFLQSTGEGERTWLAAAVGAVTGICFFLKQSLVGAGATVVIYLALRMVLRREWRLLRALVAAAAGFALVVALVSAYLGISGAWSAYLEEAFVFNLAYSNLGPLERVNALFSALVYTTSIPGLFLSLCLWLICAAVCILQAGPDIARLLSSRLFSPGSMIAGIAFILSGLAGEFAGQNPGLGMLQTLLTLAGLALIAAGLLLRSNHWRDRLTGWLANAPVFATTSDDIRLPFFHLASLFYPVTLALTSLSGRNYAYYFNAFVPALILLFGLAADLFIRQYETAAANRLGRVALLGMVLALAYHPAVLMVDRLKAPRNPAPPEVATYVQEHTRPEDTILVYGKDTTYVYFVSQRKAPSRQFYQAAIGLDTYNNRYGMATELYRDLQARPPALFIIKGVASKPGSCSLPVSDKPNSIGQVMGFICQNYGYAGQAGEFQVYQRNR